MSELYTGNSLDGNIESEPESAEFDLAAVLALLQGSSMGERHITWRIQRLMNFVCPGENPKDVGEFMERIERTRAAVLDQHPELSEFPEVTPSVVLAGKDEVPLRDIKITFLAPRT
jgi:hypothetical protein